MSTPSVVNRALSSAFCGEAPLSILAQNPILASARNVLLPPNMQVVNGIRSGSNYFLLAGAENMNNGANFDTIVDANVDAISEVKMVTSSYPAEFGAAQEHRESSKSGTPDFHGSISEFVRNNISMRVHSSIKGGCRSISTISAER